MEKEQTAKLGAEYALTLPVYLRAGYIWDSLDPDTKVALDRETGNTVTLGVGIKLFGGKYLGDVAYQHRSSKSEDQTLNHRVSDNALMLVLKGLY